MDEPIDLLNVAFENTRSLEASKKDPSGAGGRDTFAVPDRETGFAELEELVRVCPERQWNFVSLCLP